MNISTDSDTVPQTEVLLLRSCRDYTCSNCILYRSVTDGVAGLITKLNKSVYICKAGNSRWNKRDGELGCTFGSSYGTLTSFVLINSTLVPVCIWTKKPHSPAPPVCALMWH